MNGSIRCSGGGYNWTLLKTNRVPMDIQQYMTSIGVQARRPLHRTSQLAGEKRR